MAMEQLVVPGGRAKYVQMQSEPPLPAMMSSFFSFHRTGPEPARIFDELPTPTIMQVSRLDASDISLAMLTYTIEIQYEKFKWQLVKKAPQVFFLHFALKKRALVEEIQEKQEQVREWLQNLGIGEHTTVIQDEEDAEDEPILVRNEESFENR